MNSKNNHQKILKKHKLINLFKKMIYNLKANNNLNK